VTSTESADIAAAPATSRSLATAGLAALGIVFGDLGTSPLYTLQTVVLAAGGHFTRDSALGVLSLIVWTLIITVSIKYCLFVMRADNRGEGGILALMSLVGADRLSGRMGLLTAMGLLGAALIYGDGVITPAISVLSALEGVNVLTDAFKPYVMPAAVVILVLLFSVQRLGTARIGRAFGPIMLVWFVVISALGLAGIVRSPVVLTAIDPLFGLRFLAHAGVTGPLVLGGVFLCITGGEALYADMGHIGRAPIRLSWYGVVLPALLISYAGQTALLIQKGVISGNPFFQLAPAWSIYPLVALSAVATIIASQAIITGSFSMTRQAMQLGWMPGVDIRQTSDRVYGQIYVPVVNWLMMIATVGVTVAFRSSDHLSGAYGTAVSTTMLLTTCLLFSAMRNIWKWPLAVCLAVAGLFIVVDAAFFLANLLKIADGGWLPLVLGILVFLIMMTWRSGVDAVRATLAGRTPVTDSFHASVKAAPRVPGTAVFLTRLDHGAPIAIAEHIEFMGALQKSAVALMVRFEPIPRVPDAERSQVEYLGEGIWRVIIRFGFVEVPDLKVALAAVKGLGADIDLDSAIYFGNRDLVTRRPSPPRLPAWQLPLFAFLYRNAVKAVDRFNLPCDHVLEIARQLEI
jgi:KUP system potassium uptake protein